jgi:pimeloyl-ACP methyl ester carboxylesterase
MPPRPHTIPYLLAGAFHTLAFTAWGDPERPPVVCVHGLTRNGRDFDPLAGALSDRFYVICPDLPGRGASDWLADPSLYHPLSYVQALAHLLAHIGRPVCWVGTSLGGICGMLIAAAAGTPIRRLVLNDIGPFLPQAALERIVTYTGLDPVFADLGALEAYLREVHAAFGRLSDAQWAAMARHSARALPDGRLALHYDPAIATPMRAAPVTDLDMWPVWEAISVPTLTIRGETSDLLLPDTLARMAARSETLTIAATGHAPALMDAPSIASVGAFLAA